MAKNLKGKKFKSVEKDAVNAPVKNVDWEGEELAAISDTKLESDLGTGQTVVLRFFDFGANIETFKQQKPTAQDLFNSHMRGIESLLWRDGLRQFEEVEPRLIFSKDKTKYRFIIACVPRMGGSFDGGTPRTLTELLR